MPAEPTWSKENRRTGGFTLLEVMIALAILGIALVSVLALGNRSIEVNSRLERITQATLLAQGKMTEVEVQSRGQDLLATEGAFATPFDDYRWQLSFEDTPLPSVRMVTVTVLWGDEKKNEAVDVTSFIANR